MSTPASVASLERLDAEIVKAERRAALNLAEHLREAVRSLPSQSTLGLKFVQRAKDFEMWAHGSGPGVPMNATLEDLYRDLRELGQERGEEV
jgi:hypothetical protein